MRKNQKPDLPDLSDIERAIANGDSATINAMIKVMDVNSKDANGETPLHWAAYYGKKETVYALIEADWDVSTITHNGEGFQPEHIAGIRGHTGIVNVLMNYPFFLESCGYFKTELAFDENSVAILREVFEKCEFNDDKLREIILKVNAEVSIQIKARNEEIKPMGITDLDNIVQNYSETLISLPKCLLNLAATSRCPSNFFHRAQRASRGPRRVAMEEKKVPAFPQL